MKKIFPCLFSLLFAVSSEAQVSPVHCWTGHINGSIPVFIWLVEKDSVFKGEVVYTRTKNKAPITLLGQRFPDEREIRICEYLPDGTITGIYTFDKIAPATTGTWFSPATRKELNLSLVSKDTALPALDTSFEPGEIAGDYSYAYSKNGAQGSINIQRIAKGKIAFDIGCVSDAPAHDLAEVDKDTVAFTNHSFVYKLPGSENCSFRVRFYKNFLTVQYVAGHGDCGGSFGMGATVEGIFYKSPAAKQ